MDGRRRRAVLAALPLVVIAPCTLAAIASPEVFAAERVLMGTRVRVVVQAPGRAAEVAPAVDAAFAEMQRLELLLSRYRDGNPVHALQRGAGGPPMAVPPELVAALRAAGEVSRRSGGDFDITVGAYSDWRFDAPPSVPGADRLARQRALVDWRGVEFDEREGLARLARRGMRIDLGGIAKLPILDAGMRELGRHGLHDALIDGGGDVCARGRVHGRAWRVGIRDPLQPDRVLGLVEVGDGWVASSGDYERAFVLRGRRYHHVLDPRTGMPTQGPRGVTLLARDLVPINGLGTTLMVGGRGAAARLLPMHPGVDALVVDADAARWSTPGFEARLRPA